MRTILYFIAVILVIGWVLARFAFSISGMLVHVLLLLAVVALLIGILRKGSAD